MLKPPKPLTNWIMH